MSDQDTIIALRRSDKSAFEKLFFSYYQDLCNYALSFVKDEMLAEDIVQSFFKDLWEKRDKINIQSSTKAYFFRAIKNDCFDYLKSRFAQTSFESIEFNTEIDTEETSIDSVEQEELLSLIKIAIKQLPPQCETIFTLSRVANMSHKEIAAELELSPKTVENQIGIALKKTRDFIIKAQL